MALFLRGLILGVSIAAPVGPIGLLCIRRTLANGRWHGLATGIGAASADAVYGLIAVLGLSAVRATLAAAAEPLQLGGGLLLIGLGVQTWRAQPAERSTPGAKDPRGLWAAYLSGLALTLTNPLTILMFTGAFAGVGVISGSDPGGGVALVAGVFAGSGGWWLTLTGAVALLGRWLPPSTLAWVNRLSGIALIAFGAWALLH